MSAANAEHGARCEACQERASLRAYASYNADHGENVHPLHARYPGPMIRACPVHLGVLMRADAAKRGSTSQWLVVSPNSGSVTP